MIWHFLTGVTYDITDHGANWEFSWNWVLYIYPRGYHNQLKIQIPTIGDVFYGFWQNGSLKIAPDVTAVFCCGDNKSYSNLHQFLPKHFRHVTWHFWHFWHGVNHALTPNQCEKNRLSEISLEINPNSVCQVPHDTNAHHKHRAVHCTHGNTCNCFY